MTAVNCPMCELRFPSRNERDWHLRNEHHQVHVHPPAERPLTWPARPAPGAGAVPEPESTEAEQD